MTLLSSDALDLHRIFLILYGDQQHLHSFPTRRSSDLDRTQRQSKRDPAHSTPDPWRRPWPYPRATSSSVNERSEEHTSELQSPDHLVCRLLLEKKKEKRFLVRFDLCTGLFYHGHLSL